MHPRDSMRASDDQWLDPAVPKSAPPYPDANPPLTALPLWVYLLWIGAGLACLSSPLGILLGGLVIPWACGGLFLVGLAAAITLVMWSEIQSSRR